jgi:hypothetical protein
MSDEVEILNRPLTKERKERILQRIRAMENPPEATIKSRDEVVSILKAAHALLVAKPTTPSRSTARTTLAYNKPLKSTAMSVHPDQVQEMNALVKGDGLTGVYFDPKGTCWTTSRGQRARAMKLRGLRDNDGGYGDG